jgi:hypothetical protein
MWRTDDPVQAARAAAAVVALTALSLCAVTAAARMQRPGLQMGDIVRFGPASAPAADAGRRMLVHRAGQFGCVLDLGVLRRSGGSLVVDGRPEGAGPDTWRLHWAGERTSIDMADCGQDAELILSAADVRMLVAATGQMPALRHE